MDKTKILVCCAKPVQSGKPSGKWPCGVCGKGVGRNSILCTQCGKWIHKRCSGVKGSLESCKNFKCGKCLNVVASDEMSDSKAESTTVGLEFVRRSRLRWFGHVVRKDDQQWVRKCMDFKVDGSAGRGRPRKSWLKCVNDDMKSLV